MRFILASQHITVNPLTDQGCEALMGRVFSGDCPWGSFDRLIAITVLLHALDDDNPSLSRIARGTGLSQARVKKGLRILSEPGGPFRIVRIDGGVQ